MDEEIKQRIEQSRNWYLFYGLIAQGVGHLQSERYHMREFARVPQLRDIINERMPKMEREYRADAESYLTDIDALRTSMVQEENLEVLAAINPHLILLEHTCRSILGIEPAPTPQDILRQFGIKDKLKM